VSNATLTDATAETLLRHIVRQKFEQRGPSGDVHDDFISFLSGKQKSQMEISYTKQQQKQKQTQQNKNQDSDAMGVFHKKNQLVVSFKTDNYFEYALSPRKDMTKVALNLPVHVPILTLVYNLDDRQHTINVYPTLQFLYSHHIQPDYITQEVQESFQKFQRANDPASVYKRFSAAIGIRGDTHNDHHDDNGADDDTGSRSNEGATRLGIHVVTNHVCQNPQYTIAAIRPGVYVIGMKDQFNAHDLPRHPMYHQIQYVTDEMGFVMFDRPESERRVDGFGPYFVENYILMEVLSKQEVAQNVLEYYCDHRDALQKGIDGYGESQGKGFICWRFLMNDVSNKDGATTAAK